MTFVGIENTNEFFTQHYLTAILAGDLRPVLERWRAIAKEPHAEAATAAAPSRRPPPLALGASHQDFFRYLDRLDHEPSPEARVAAHFETFTGLLVELGYAEILRHGIASLPSGEIPLYGEIRRADGSPNLWMIPVVPGKGVKLATLSTAVTPEQLAAARVGTSAAQDEARPTGERTAEDLVNEAFNLDEPPRFILVLGLDDIVLVERAKWAEQRLLRFDLREILGRRQTDTLDVTAALLHRESLAPPDGIALIDNLDENSHKHAFAVSEDLKYALQASIERLGNAAIDYIRRVKKQKVFGDQGENEELADKLSRECLRYMYRLLFLFYIEARRELGYAPMDADTYRLGYSLERLRGLEQLDLSTEEARSGTYIHRSLRLLFEMIFDGRKPAAQVGFAPNEAGELAASHFSVFELAPLRAHLFDPARTPLLDGGSYQREGGVVFSNEVLRDVIENMSLTRPGKGRRGRISYATLGINQLGAVYEALLSFRGLFAKTDLFEVKPADAESHGVLDIAYFVAESDLPKYSDAERVYDGDKLRRYPKGTFIYRLAGRDRQTSASYYTPEVLTRATVKYALRELLEDESGAAKLTADEILHVTVCEPAMGSAAFLNEAVNQLAEAYLSAKQRERGDRIPHDRYAFEKQRVKMFIADNNVFGVDLNPIAVELAEVSLWLNTIHEGGFVPWFTGQTVCGNSLIGARRQIFPAPALRAGKDGKENGWLDTVPTRVPLGAPRPEGSVYHFFLGDRSMSVYGRGQEGAPIREMAKEPIGQIDEWRQAFCAPLKDDEVGTMVRLSGIVDGLWEKHADLLRRIRLRTTDPIEIFGQPPLDETRKPTTTAEKDRVWAQEMLSESVRASSPYQARDGLLVRTLVLADAGGHAAAGQRGVPRRHRLGARHPRRRAAARGRRAGSDVRGDRAG